MIRAWRARDRFEGRSSLRTWLYHIATNVCFDALRRRRRHAVAVDLGPGSTHSAAGVAASGDGPAELAERSDNIRLAFVIALRRLPPTQRVAVILHDVFRWKANEVAALLEHQRTGRQQRSAASAGDAPRRRPRGARCGRRRAAAPPRPSRRRLRPARRGPARDVGARRHRRRLTAVAAQPSFKPSTSRGAVDRSGFTSASRHGARPEEQPMPPSTAVAHRWSARESRLSDDVRSRSRNDHRPDGDTPVSVGNEPVASFSETPSIDDASRRRRAPNTIVEHDRAWEGPGASLHAQHDGL